jgi:hypothetical protein
MPMPVNSGAQELAALARRLKDAGEGGLRRQLYTGIRTAAEPVLGEIRAEMPSHMPNRYAGVLGADLVLSTSVRAGKTASVRLKGVTRGKNRQIARLDRGILVHPLFGSRARWFAQGPLGGGMRPGFFSGPIEHAVPQLRSAVLGAMRRTAEKITGK